MTEIPDVMTTKEAGRAMKLKPAAVRRRLNRGELRGTKLGRGWRVYADSIAESLGKEAVKHLSERATSRADLNRVAIARATLDLMRRGEAART